MNEINNIDKYTDKEYMKSRFQKLFSLASHIKYDSMISSIYNKNLLMIDTKLPEMFGYFILFHFVTMGIYNLDCINLCDVLEDINPLNFGQKWLYKHNIKEMLSEFALGMIPGVLWNRQEVVDGGYIIVKKNGDIVCFNIYNRGSFQDYLLNNTIIDRPSASRHDYAYIFKEDGHYYINLNIQIRFKKISSDTSYKTNLKKNEILEFMRKNYNKIK